MPGIGFDPGGIHFGQVEGRPYNARGNAAEYQKNAAPIFQKSAADINLERTPLSIRPLVTHSLVTEAQVAAVRRAYQERQPYLAPEHKIPGDTSVKSLLATKTEHDDTVIYGTLSMPKSDAQLFDKLQHELSAIDEQRAVRQLFQVMHGHVPTRLTFKDDGISGAFANYKGRNYIQVNPLMTVLDPVSGIVTPLSVVLGHEIEHVNPPSKITQSLRLSQHDGFSNAEEVRVIDGYENGMHGAIGKGDRSTHMSHSLPLKPGESSEIAFPYYQDGRLEVIAPGQRLTGKILGADHERVTIETSAGKRVQIDTPVLLSSACNISQVLKCGFKDCRSNLEQVIDFQKTARAAALHVRAVAPDEFEEIETLFETMRHMQVHTPEAKAKIAEWQDAARRGDTISVSVNPKGLINLSRVSDEANPHERVARRAAKLRLENLRNRVIAVSIGGGILTVTGASLLAAALVAGSPPKPPSATSAS